MDIQDDFGENLIPLRKIMQVVHGVMWWVVLVIDKCATSHMV